MINYAPFCNKQVAYLLRCYSNWLNVAEGGTLYRGTLDEAFAANRWDPCDTCAGGDQAKLDEAAADDTTETTEEQPAG